PSAKIDNPLDIFGSIGDGGNLRHANDFADHGNRQPKCFAPDPKANDLNFFFHVVVALLGSGNFRVFGGRFSVHGIGTAWRSPGCWPPAEVSATFGETFV